MIVVHVQRFHVRWVNRFLLAVNVAFLALPLALVALFALIWDWPMNIGGKPSFLLYQNVPVNVWFNVIVAHPWLFLSGYLIFS